MNDAPVLNPEITDNWLLSSTAATSGMASLAAPVLREQGISAVTNIHNMRISTLVNSPTATTLEIFGISNNSNNKDFQTWQLQHRRERAEDTFHTLCYRLTSKLDLKDHPSVREHKGIPLTFLLRSTRITAKAGRSESSLFPPSFCALVPDYRWHPYT